MKLPATIEETEDKHRLTILHPTTKRPIAMIDLPRNEGENLTVFADLVDRAIASIDGDCETTEAVGIGESVVGLVISGENP